MRIKTLLTVVALTAACGEKPAPPPPAPVQASTPIPTPPPPTVGMVTLGNAIGADKSITAATEGFATKDVIYASVATTGVGHCKLRALWSFTKGDKTVTVDERTLEFDSTGPSINEFHIENPKGWPKGDYRVEIFQGESATPIATKTFKVQ